MSLGAKDKEWVLEQILSKRSGWGKVSGFIKDWSATGGVVAIVLFALTIWNKFTEFRVHTEDSITNIEKRLGKLEAVPYETILRKLPDNPTVPQIQEVMHAFTDARTGSIKVAPELLANAGAKFIEASEVHPMAWEATTEPLAYRSFLNADYIPKLNDLTLVSNEKYTFSLNVHNDEHFNFQIYHAGGRTTPENSARLETLTLPNQTTPNIGLIVIDSKHNTIGIDDFFMKNVIIRNSVIEYKGGPLKLQNVYFVNCTFKFPTVEPSRGLALAILQSPNATFTKTA